MRLTHYWLHCKDSSKILPWFIHDPGSKSKINFSVTRTNLLAQDFLNLSLKYFWFILKPNNWLLFLTGGSEASAEKRAPTSKKLWYLKLRKNSGCFPGARFATTDRGLLSGWSGDGLWSRNHAMWTRCIHVIGFPTRFAAANLGVWVAAIFPVPGILQWQETEHNWTI